MSRRPVLDLVVAPAGNRLAVSGELDIAVASRLVAVLTGLELGRRPLTVDLSEVSFADSHGLSPLIDAMNRRVEQRVAPLQLRGMRPRVQKIFDLLTSTDRAEDSVRAKRGRE